MFDVQYPKSIALPQRIISDIAPVARRAARTALVETADFVSYLCAYRKPDEQEWRDAIALSSRYDHPKGMEKHQSWDAVFTAGDACRFRTREVHIRAYRPAADNPKNIDLAFAVPILLCDARVGNVPQLRVARERAFARSDNEILFTPDNPVLPVSFGAHTSTMNQHLTLKVRPLGDDPAHVFITLVGRAG